MTFNQGVLGSNPNRHTNFPKDVMFMYKKEPVKGYEEYQVDTNGIIYSKKGKPLKYSLNHSGYCMVNFYVNDKRTGFAIHTLVAKQFVHNDNPANKTQVNHIDGNKKNNNANNLEWVTPIENVRHCIDILGINKLGINNPNAKKIRGIKINGYEDILDFDTIIDAAKYFCKDGGNPRYAQNSICRVLKGLRNSYKGYYWKYI